ncbi:MAG: hypothetical protein ACYC35_20815 [Pirellulales bacterium]
MFWKRCGLVCLLTVFALSLGRLALPEQAAISPEDPLPAALDARIRPFFEEVAAGGAETAYPQLLAGSSLQKQTEAVKSLIEKTKTLVKKYGEYRAAESIDMKRVGKDLVILRYLYKCDDFPVVWYFTFYRDFKTAAAATDEKSNWVLVSVRFDTELEMLRL